MYKNSMTFIIAVALIAFTTSCSKNGSTGPAGPAGPSYTGAISGHVALYDQYGSRVLTGLNTAQLQLDGAAAISPDATGYYYYGNIKTGGHNIVATAAGYASTRTNNFQFLSDTLNRDIKLSAIPNFSPASVVSYSNVGSSGDSVIVNFAPDTRVREMILFVNTNSTVNGQPGNYLVVYPKAIPANATKVTISIPASDLYDAGITSGTTIYLAAYGYVVTDGSAYEDITTGKIVYNAVSASPVTATATAP